jgi:hypothetical protein
MHLTCHRLIAPVVLVIGTSSLLAGLCGRLRAESAPATSISKAEYVRLVKELDFKSQPWTQIPWKVSVTEARQLAAKEGKPIFLVVNTGNCLGWT